MYRQIKGILLRSSFFTIQISEASEVFIVTYMHVILLFIAHMHKNRIW